MTTPYERTQAIARTRDLLKELSAGKSINADTLRGRAKALLKHFPTPADVDLSAAALPNIWSRMDAKWYE